MSEIYTATLISLGTDRFQPTGFPDIGAATYRSPSGVEKLLVESEQSVANRLENVCWDKGQQDLVEDLSGVPYVRVMDNGEYMTSSVVEAHRMGSVYVVKTDFFADVFFKELNYEELGGAKFHELLFKYDPNSLVHGLFLPKIAGALRVTRVLTGFIEAEGVSEVACGGVKIDHLDAAVDNEGGKGSKEGYGNVPYSRTDFVASSIKAIFKVDTNLIKSFRLGQEATDFLVALCKYKIRAFLDQGLRLRSRCEFVVEQEPNNLSDLETLRKELRSAIDKVKNFAPVTLANFNEGLSDSYKTSPKKRKTDESKAAKAKEKEAKKKNAKSSEKED